MADTRIQIEVEDWVRANWLSAAFGQQFHRNRIKLSSGGLYNFDAVSNDRSIAACISTSGGRTSSGKLGVGKLFKLRSDMLYLVLATGVSRRLIILTESDMLQVCEKERTGGRVPLEIEFHLADIPAELRQRLVKARAQASKEVTPSKISQLPDELPVGRSE